MRDAISKGGDIAHYTTPSAFIALTEACRVFLMEARAILARAGAAELAQSEFGTLKRGTLCVQASQTIAGFTLPRHLVAFQRAHRRVSNN